MKIFLGGCLVHSWVETNENLCVKFPVSRDYSHSVIRARRQSLNDFKSEQKVYKGCEEVSMLNLIQPNDLTRAEQVAAKAAYAASEWQPFFVIGIGVLAVAMAFLNGSSRDTLVWMGISFAAVTWTTWEHWGFNNLLERRDTEIRRLKEAIKV